MLFQAILLTAAIHVVNSIRLDLEREVDAEINQSWTPKLKAGQGAFQPNPSDELERSAMSEATRYGAHGQWRIRTEAAGDRVLKGNAAKVLPALEAAIKKAGNDDAVVPELAKKAAFACGQAMIQEWMTSYAKVDPNILQYTVGNEPSSQDCIVHPEAMVAGEKKPVTVDRKLFCPGVKSTSFFSRDQCYKVCLVSTVYPSIVEGRLWLTPTNWLLNPTSESNVKSAFKRLYFSSDAAGWEMDLCYD